MAKPMSKNADLPSSQLASGWPKWLQEVAQHEKAKTEEAKAAAAQIQRQFMAGPFGVEQSTTEQIRDLVQKGYSVSATLTPVIAGMFLPPTAYKTVEMLVMVEKRWKPVLEKYIQVQIRNTRNAIEAALKSGNVQSIEETVALDVIGGGDDAQLDG